MRKSFLIFLLLASSTVFSDELDTRQSSSSVDWQTISNSNVKLIYPDFLKGESTYIANLVQHYSTYVGQTYGITNPSQFTLIIRPEVASPNGFVTLGPRRSEWFSSSAFSNFVGSSEWYQTLSIHEYRHVVQFQNYDSTFIRVVNYLFGDYGKQILMFTGLQPWYFEGDAVWTETKYTDGGRGRSPYFLARLKALVLSDRIPTYDEFVNGSYNTLLPNHYVFGYVLISNATKKFGDDFWSKVIKLVAREPHPFILYSAFEQVSGQTFLDFYDETMNDLREKWKKDISTVIGKSDYRENTYPSKDGESVYYLHRSLDSYWSINKMTKEGSTKILDIPFYEELAQVSIRNGKAVYPEFLPDKRYAYKGSADLFLVDLKSGEKTKITSGQRLYAPRLNSAGTQFLAVNFTDDHLWNINEYDLSGHIIRKVNVRGYKVSEASYLNANEAVAILNDERGYKSIQKVDLNSGSMEILLPASRNNIYSLNVDPSGSVYFEAQYKGYVNVFRIKDMKTSQCTQSKIGASSPYSDGLNLYYSNQDSYGSQVAMVPVSACKAIDGQTLVDFNYLSDSPSDNFNNFPPQSFNDQVELRTKNEADYKAESYGDFDSRLFTPHSWSFIGGRGLELSATTVNYLNTLGIKAVFGRDSEEKESFGSLSVDIKKYYPIFNISTELRDRSEDIYSYGNDLKWREKSVGITMTVPYIFKRGLFNVDTYLMGGARYLDASRYLETNIDLRSPDRAFHITTGGAGFTWAKDLTPRSIISPLAVNASTQYDNAASTGNEQYSSYRLYGHAQVQVPGLFKHHGFFVTYDQEKQKDNRVAYQFRPFATDAEGYVFSRGYKYEAVSDYNKVTGNYVFPIAYPDLNLRGLYYLKRLYGTLFFDSTRIDSQYLSETLNSYGAELEFESKFLRIIPITFGLRYSYKLKDNEGGVAGVFVTTALGF